MAQAYFIITDISGYTEFLTHSELDHAHDKLQTLFHAQLAHIKPPFIISGFEGDAIFMYIPEESFIKSQSVLESLEGLFISFSNTLEQLQYQSNCPCKACQALPLLGLKMVVHYGSYLIQKIGDREELLGADVIVPHRMLKNNVVDQTGIKSYALFTEAAMKALRLPDFEASLHPYSDFYPHIGEVKMVVYDLSSAWKREKARRSKVITPQDAWVKFETDIDAPPSLVWDYLTAPNLRVEMTGLDFMERVDELGRRVGEGSKYYCVHGDVEFSYEIVDWNPFDHLTILQKDSSTQLEYFETCYMSPSAQGTHFMSCVGKPEGEVPADLQATIQGQWDLVYGRIKEYIEMDNHS